MSPSCRSFCRRAGDVLKSLIVTLCFMTLISNFCHAAPNNIQGDSSQGSGKIKATKWGINTGNIEPVSVGKWPGGSRLRRAVSLIRLKKDGAEHEDYEYEENDIDHPLFDKRAMSMMRLRRAMNPRVSLIRLRRTPVSMLRLRRKISQLRLKKSSESGRPLECDWMCQEDALNKAGMDLDLLRSLED